MQLCLGFGYQISCQDFIWVGNCSLQNVIVLVFGSSGKFLVFGVYYDIYYGCLILQGLDDNVLGVVVFIEIVCNFGGIVLENGFEVVGFGVEEEGLCGLCVYVEFFDVSQCVNLLGMINFDSLVIGDKMYVYVGFNSVFSLVFGVYCEQILCIVCELDILLFINFGLNVEYLVGIGCCSDGESFNGMDILVLFIEVINWELGDLDGYEQIDNLVIFGGLIWYDLVEDNKEVLINVFGQECIE